MGCVASTPSWTNTDCVSFEELGDKDTYYQMSRARGDVDVNVPIGKEYDQEMVEVYRINCLDEAQIWVVTSKTNASVTFRKLKKYDPYSMLGRNRVIFYPDKVEKYTDRDYEVTFTKQEWHTYCHVIPNYNNARVGKPQYKHMSFIKVDNSGSGSGDIPDPSGDYFGNKITSEKVFKEKKPIEISKYGKGIIGYDSWKHLKDSGRCKQFGWDVNVSKDPKE